MWRYKGADKGITNVVMPDAETLVVADRDDLIVIDARTGKRRNEGVASCREGRVRALE